jgi:hypothetical protein
VQIDLLSDLSKAESEYKDAKDKVEYKRASLYSDADFKELGKTNAEQRKGYVDVKVHDKMVEVKLGEKEIQYNHLKRVYEMSLAETRSSNNFYGNVTAVLDEQNGIKYVGAKP